MAGGELLKIAKLKSVISEFESYKVAVDNFKTQYENLPGDIPNATSFWTTAQNSGTAVANGNGNEKIGAAGTDLSGSGLESYYLWNHLTLSKFVPGTFAGDSTSAATTGTNVPLSKFLESVGFSINYFATPFSYVDAIGRNFPGNYMAIGKTSGSNNYLSENALVPTDASYIDSKIDDGTPDFGKVLGADGAGGALCTSGSAPDIIYNKSAVAVGCILLVSID